jgi:hypothetical protein
MSMPPLSFDSDPSKITVSPSFTVWSGPALAFAKACEAEKTWKKKMKRKVVKKRVFINITIVVFYSTG